MCGHTHFWPAGGWGEWRSLWSSWFLFVRPMFVFLMIKTCNSYFTPDDDDWWLTCFFHCSGWWVCWVFVPLKPLMDVSKHLWYINVTVSQLDHKTKTLCKSFYIPCYTILLFLEVKNRTFQILNPCGEKNQTIETKQGWCYFHCRTKQNTLLFKSGLAATVIQGAFRATSLMQNWRSEGSRYGNPKINGARYFEFTFLLTVGCIRQK